MHLSGPSIERITIIYRILTELVSRQKETASSRMLSLMTGFPAHTIRKDISLLGATEGSGSGYVVKNLMQAIQKALGFDKQYKACIVGLGRIGSALINYQGFSESGYVLAAGFDCSINKLEITDAPFPLFPASQIPEVVAEKGIELGIIAVPAHAAQETAERLIRGGVKGIVNYAPIIIRHDSPGVIIRNTYVVGELRILTAQLSMYKATMKE